MLRIVWFFCNLTELMSASKCLGVCVYKILLWTISIDEMKNEIERDVIVRLRREIQGLPRIKRNVVCKKKEKAEKQACCFLCVYISVKHFYICKVISHHL